VSNDHVLPFPDVTVYTFGVEPEDYGNPEKGADVVIKERGCALILRFEGRTGDAPLIELRIGPEKGRGLEPTKAKEFVPRIEDYVAVARAALEWDLDAVREAAEVLRQAARPGRGHSPDFFRLIAIDYKNLVAAGEKAPVKALGKRHHVEISAASRWLTEARRRGYLPPKEAKSNAR
jgi:hypothetical protein